jgi:hypothetical protein
MKSKLFFTSLMMAVATGVVATAAFAQPSAAAKARGDNYNWYSGQTYGSTAYEHARILNQYSTAGKAVPKEVIQEHSTAIRSNVEGARKAYSRLTEETKKNPEVAKKLTEIEKHHAKVLAACDMLDGECAKAEGDSAVVMSCCVDIAKELKAANAAHHDLTKKLKVENYLPKE